MGMGSAWLEALLKRARQGMTALALGTSTLAGTTMIVYGLSTMERMHARQVILDKADSCVHDVTIPVPIKRECLKAANESGCQVLTILRY